jgi:thioredoxin-like negative regulator of GroEL
MTLARPFRLSALALAIASAAPAALAEAPRPASTTTASTRPAAALPRLVFFMNPGGAPCQMQDRILQEMAPELKGKAEVVYLKTTVPGDIARFQQYGIRALPTLVVTDASGKEIRRATPGIQSATQVRQLVQN